MHTIKHTNRAIEISRWFWALEYCEIEAVHKHNGIHRTSYKYVRQMFLVIVRKHLSYAQKLTHVVKAKNKRKRNYIRTAETWNRQGGGDSCGKCGCRKRKGRLFDRVRSTAIVRSQTSMNERRSNTQVRLSNIHTYRAIEISRWFLALEYCEIEAVHKHNGIHRAWYKYVGQIGLFLKCEHHKFSLSYENI